MAGLPAARFGRQVLPGGVVHLDDARGSCRCCRVHDDHEPATRHQVKQAKRLQQGPHIRARPPAPHLVRDVVPDRVVATVRVAQADHQVAGHPH